jgi:hypothetical protein
MEEVYAGTGKAQCTGGGKMRGDSFGLRRSPGWCGRRTSLRRR